MNIYTSYFANIRNLPTNVLPVAISLKIPDFYTGPAYKQLAPSPELLAHWKEHVDPEFYMRVFNNKLSNMRPKDVVDDLQMISNNKDVALICYEAPNDFCHRHLVAQWLTDAGYTCKEYTKEGQST